MCSIMRDCLIVNDVFGVLFFEYCSEKNTDYFDFSNRKGVEEPFFLIFFFFCL